MLEVAALAASAPAVLSGTAITATCRRTRSAANSGIRSSRPPAQRNSIDTLRPSTYPVSLKPLRNASSRLTLISAEVPPRNPITGIAVCCARAASGHAAAAPPSKVMNSRRLTLDLPLQSRSTARSACHRVADESYDGPWPEYHDSLEIIEISTA
jgi:hypothetical protein